MIHYRFRVSEFGKVFLTEVLVRLVDSFTISVVSVASTPKPEEVYLSHANPLAQGQSVEYNHHPGRSAESWQPRGRMVNGGHQLTT